MVETNSKPVILVKEPIPLIIILFQIYHLHYWTMLLDPLKISFSFYIYNVIDKNDSVAQVVYL